MMSSGEEELLGERYRVMEEIGRGSTARVYRAFDKEELKEYAVKRITKSFIQIPKNKERVLA
jgi:serine/threonine protein kinase